MIFRIFNKVILGIVIICILIGCGSLYENGSSEIQNEGTQNIVSFYDVYRLSDNGIEELIKGLPEIQGFTPIQDLEDGNYLDNIIGITDNEENKKRILRELLDANSLPENSFFCWSKYKDRMTDNNSYYLYLLKEFDESLRIINSEIAKAEVITNKFTNNIEVLIKFDKKGTEKWSEITEKAAMNNNGFIAIVVDSEVYTCPYVMSPIDNGYISISGFEEKEEAEMIVTRINKVKK